MSISPKRPSVVITEGSSPAPMAWLQQQADVVEVAPDAPSFAAALQEADALVVRTYTKVDAPLLNRAPQLKVIGRGGVGLENIDVAACRARGVQVVYTPEANSRAVAEFVVGVLIKLIRPWRENATGLFVPDAFRAMRESAGDQLCDLRLGILGMGRVGRAVARAAWGGFCTTILYHDLVDVSARVDVPAQPVSFEKLLGESDVLSIHVDARSTNRNLMSVRALEGARFRWLINTSRGLVVDAGALAPALRTGPLQGVAIDVFEPEPPPAGSAYAQLMEEFPDRVILTPHMASRTHRALQNMSWVVRDVIEVLEGRPPRWPAP